MQSTILLLLCSMLIAPDVVQAKQHALLIGVSDYQSTRITDLEGPQFDVPALQNALTKHWGISEENIVSLINEQATESNIKRAFNDLHRRTEPGDDIVIYFSGHGTSIKDPDFGAKLILPDTSGALVTYDFDPAKHVARIRAGEPVKADDDGLLVGRYEIKPLLQSLNKDRTVLVVIDSCFSGNAVRGKSGRYTPKHKRLLNITLGSEQTSEIRTGVTGASRCLNCETQDDTTLFEYDNVIYFGAAADNQLAVDYSQSEIDAGLVSTIDNKPHGGFTDALLRVLSSDNTQQQTSLSYRRLFNLLTSTFAANCPNCGHNPVLLPTQNTASLSKAFLSSVRQNPTPSTLGLQAILQIDPQNLDSTIVTAMLRLPAVELNRRSADIVLFQRGVNIEAIGADGLLISKLPGQWNATRLTQWVDDQRWLKQRKQNDATNNQGAIHASFRHPLTNAVAFAGESVYFTMALETDAKLVVLLTNSLGEMNLLYPHTDAEAAQIFKATTTFKFPAPDEFQLTVSPPWGTDNVAFYALDPMSDLGHALLPLAQVSEFRPAAAAMRKFSDALDSKQHAYSAAHVRFHATR